MFWAIRATVRGPRRASGRWSLVFDDVHWGEPTFLDLVEHIADWTRDAPILLIGMARPELLEKRPAWGGGKRSATTMPLEPLSEIESDELVASLLGRPSCRSSVAARSADAAEGNPLFVEELLGMLIDDGFLVTADDSWAAIGRSAPAGDPAHDPGAAGRAAGRARPRGADGHRAGIGRGQGLPSRRRHRAGARADASARFPTGWRR